jgi:hypothetical protein
MHGDHDNRPDPPHEGRLSGPEEPLSVGSRNADQGGEPSNAVRLAVMLPSAEYTDLQRMAAEEGVSMELALRRAIGTEKFLRDSAKAGSKVLLRDPDGRYRQVLILR